MNVPYDKQTVNAKNYFARFAHRTRLNISLNIISKIANLKGTSILDYGCGDGLFLSQIKQKFPNFNLSGYDPYSQKTYDSFNLINNLSEIKDKKFDVICSFETLEHLNFDEKKELFLLIKNILKDNGKFVVSVPIIGGLVLILKEFNRMMMFKRKSDYSLNELLLAAFFNVSAKRADNIKISHKGFNFKTLENELKENFLIISKVYTPFKFIPWFLNSTVFYILEKK